MTKNAMKKLVSLNMSGLLAKVRADLTILEDIRYTTVVIGNNHHDGAAYCINVGTKGKVQIVVTFDGLAIITSFKAFKGYSDALEFLNCYVVYTAKDLMFEFNYKKVVFLFSSLL
jgi:hypothetical protein